MLTQSSQSIMNLISDAMDAITVSWWPYTSAILWP